MAHFQGEMMPYYSCSDVRIFTTGNHVLATLAVTLLPGDTVRGINSVKNGLLNLPGFTAQSYEMVDKTAFVLSPDGSTYSINLILKDSVGFPLLLFRFLQLLRPIVGFLRLLFCLFALLDWVSSRSAGVDAF